MLFSGFPNLTAQWDETKEVASFEGKTKLTSNFRGRCQRDYNSSISHPGILTARSIVGILCPYNVVINIWFSGTARFFFGLCDKSDDAVKQNRGIWGGRSSSDCRREVSLRSINIHRKRPWGGQTQLTNPINYQTLSQLISVWPCALGSPRPTFSAWWKSYW